MKKYLSIALLTGALMFSGCGNSDEFVFTNNTNVQVAPICADDAYTTNQNAVLTVSAANGVLANDQPNGGTVAFSATSAQGGTVAGNANGGFTYTPPTDFNGTDSFTYTVTNAAGQVTCTVTITVISTNGFFVDAANGNDGTGSFTNGLPFQTIQAAVAAAPTNADIVVLPGSYTGAVNLKDGQRLLGSGSVLAQGATRPQLTGPVVMADGNTLDFLRIEGTNGDAVDGDGQTTGIVTNCEIANITNNGDGISLDNTQGTWNTSDNQISNIQGVGVGIGIIASDPGPDTAVYIANNNTITGNDSAGILLISQGTSDVRASVVGNVLRGNNLVLGDAFELEVQGTSTFCLNLENNIADLDTNPNNSDDGVFSLFDSTGASVLSVEQFAGGNLTNPQPGGAGNSGIIEDNTGIGGDLPTSVADGACGF